MDAKSLLEALAGASPAPDDAWARLYGASTRSRDLADAPGSRARFCPSRSPSASLLSRRCIYPALGPEALGEWDALEGVCARMGACVGPRRALSMLATTRA